MSDSSTEFQWFGLAYYDNYLGNDTPRTYTRSYEYKVNSDSSITHSPTGNYWIGAQQNGSSFWRDDTPMTGPSICLRDNTLDAENTYEQRFGLTWDQIPDSYPRVWITSGTIYNN
jgi:hypothetical protein